MKIKGEVIWRWGSKGSRIEVQWQKETSCDGHRKTSSLQSTGVGSTTELTVLQEPGINITTFLQWKQLG